MGKGRKKIIFSWILIFIWMGIIISFSADNAEKSKEKSSFILEKIEPVVINAASKVGIDNVDQDFLHFFIRKNAHMFNYFILGILVFNGIRLLVSKDRLRIFFSAFYTISFSAADEFYQTFIPGRSGEVRDVFIDNIGSLSGIALIFLFFRINERKKEF